MKTNWEPGPDGQYRTSNGQIAHRLLNRRKGSAYCVACGRRVKYIVKDRFDSPERQRIRCWSQEKKRRLRVNLKGKTPLETPRSVQQGAE